MVEISRQLQRGLTVLRVATILLYVVVGTALVYVWSQQRQTNQALCALRAHYQQRTETDANYLIRHPHGTLITITQLESLREVDKALSNLSCPAV